jgi:hypothetical protein
MTRVDLPIQVALVVSLALHLSLFGSWYMRDSLRRIHLLAPLARIIQTVTGERPKPASVPATPIQTITFVDVPEPPPQADRSPAEPSRPHTFIDVDPEQASTEEPEHADLYSDRPSVASNPDNPTGQEDATPYLEGRETRFLGTEDRQHGQAAAPARPATPPVPAVPPSPATPPADTEKQDELADQGLKQQSPQEAKRPATVLARESGSPGQSALPAAPALPASSGLPGAPAATSKAKLNAVGVSRKGITAFNVAGSPFGEYDKKLIAAVRGRWYALIDRYGIYERTGEVTLYFRLYDDGTVHDLERRANSAGEILALYCEKAIVDSAPFDPLPPTLRVLVGKEPREVNFTFYY